MADAATPPRSGRRISLANVDMRRRSSAFKRSILAPFAKGPAKEAEDEAPVKAVPGMVKQRWSMMDNLDGKVLQWLLAMATIVALFAPDLFVLLTLPEHDGILEYTLFVTLLLFFLELVLSAAYKNGYLGSFYFWLDLVAMLSLLPDIAFIWDALTSSDAANPEEQENLAILRAGRLVRTGTRTTRALRLVKFVRFARIMRIFRLIRLFRAHVTHQMLQDDVDEVSQAPNKLGLRLADLLGKRVIFMVILLLLVLPYMEVSRVDTSADQGLDMLQALYNSSEATDAVQATQAQLYIDGQPRLLELVVLNRTLVEATFTVETHRFDLLVGVATSSGKSFAIFDETSFEEQQALLNIILTLSLIALMAVSAFYFNRDVHKLVVRPIKKVTEVIRKLAKTLFLLSKDDEAGDDSDELLESHFIDNVVNQLVTYFRVDATAAADDDDEESKAGGRYKDKGADNDNGKGRGSGSLGGGGSAQVHPVPTRARTILQSPTAWRKTAVSEVQDMITDEEVSHMESFETFWQDKQSLQFFKVFLTSEFAVESLLFVEQADSYKERWTRLSSFHKDLVRKYVDETAENQVNIDDGKRRKILLHDGAVFGADLYDEARHEMYKQLERDNFPRFKKSKLARDLLRLKKNQLAERMVDGPTGKTPEENADSNPPKGLVRTMDLVKTFSERLKATLSRRVVVRSPSIQNLAVLDEDERQVEISAPPTTE